MFSKVFCIFPVVSFCFLLFLANKPGGDLWGVVILALIQPKQLTSAQLKNPTVGSPKKNASTFRVGNDLSFPRVFPTLQAKPFRLGKRRVFDYLGWRSEFRLSRLKTENFQFLFVHPGVLRRGGLMRLCSSAQARAATPRPCQLAPRAHRDSSRATA